MKDLKNYQETTARPWVRRRLKALLLIALATLLLLPAAVPAVRKAADAVTPRTPPPPALPTGDALFPVACSLLPNAVEQDGKLTATAQDGTILQYSIDTRLQQSMDDFFGNRRPPYALFIALEPTTGRVLALTTSSTGGDWGNDALYRLFPMASLFKMVTAAAALERNKVTPASEITYRGSAISENPKNWDPRPRGGALKMDLTDAMGKSVNPIYGKLASDLLGKQAMEATCTTFGFNRPLIPGIPAAPSQANVPDNVYGLRLMGSGLDHNLKVSPLHAAAITAAFANNGILMAPRLIDTATRNWAAATLHPPHEVIRVVEPRVAEDLRRMLLTTVSSGTSRKAFRTHNGRRLLATMQVAAKTGTINGDAPAGQYTWFAAYAPANKPRIALLALVINDGRWRIKASNVGEHALTAYFKEELVAAPAIQPARGKGQELRKKNTGKTSRHQAARKKGARPNRPGRAV